MSGDGGMTAANYPRDSETDVVLRDGSTVHVRPVRSRGRGAIAGLPRRLCHPSRSAFASLACRTCSGPRRGRWTSTTPTATRSSPITGEAQRRSSPTPPTSASASERAEVAFLVADDWQGRGISTIMLAHLASVADRHGIATFTARCAARQPPDDRRLPPERLPRRAALRRRTRSRSSCRPRSPPEAIDRFEERERTAAVAAVRTSSRPHSVAVIGASRRRGTIGGEVLHNLVTGGYSGALYAVNPQRRRGAVAARLPLGRRRPGAGRPGRDRGPRRARSSRSRASAQRPACARLLVISAGFAEAGAEGGRASASCVAVCRAAGMRLVGPNCLGVLNTAPDVEPQRHLRAPGRPPGRVGFLSQSGGLGIAIIEAAGRLRRRALVVRLGRQQGRPVRQRLPPATGSRTRTPTWPSSTWSRSATRASSRASRRRFARRKPIVAVKSGRSAAGARATSSHTGALLAASDVTVDALFHQAGVIRTDTLHELFDVAALLAKQPVPRGDRVAIVTNAGGPGSSAPTPARPTASRCRSSRRRRCRGGCAGFLPASRVGRQPDRHDRHRIGRRLRDARCAALLERCLRRDRGDLRAAAGHPGRRRRRGDRATRRRTPECTIAAVFMTARAPPAELARRTRRGVRASSFPEDAARAIALAARHGALAQPRRRAAARSSTTAGPTKRRRSSAEALAERSGLAGAGARSPRC